MSKSTKHKKSKVPKLTEAEYTAYITSLKTNGDIPLEAPTSALIAQKIEKLPK